jgi:hypothetical protein
MELAEIANTHNQGTVTPNHPNITVPDNTSSKNQVIPRNKISQYIQSHK